MSEYYEKLEVKELLNFLMQIPSDYMIEVGADDSAYMPHEHVHIVVEDEEKKVYFYQGC